MAIRPEDALAHIAIRQFAPTARNLGIGGAYGWGFDIGRYRVVMYGPPEADTQETRDVAIRNARNDFHRRDKFRNYGRTEEEEAQLEWSERRRTRDEHHEPTREKKPRLTHAPEHPPAHVHVIELAPSMVEVLKRNSRGFSKLEMQSLHRESRYELVESDDGHHHALLMAPVVREDGSMSRKAEQHLRTMLRDDDTLEANLILNNLAPLLIEHWKRLYAKGSYSEQQVAANTILQAGYDEYVTAEVHIPTAHGERELLRRKQGSNVAYFEHHNASPLLRVIYDEPEPPAAGR